MKKVKYIGQYEAELPTLGLFVNTGDVIEVEDDFDNVLFVLGEEVFETPTAPDVPDAPEAQTDLKGDK